MGTYAKKYPDYNKNAEYRCGQKKSYWVRMFIRKQSNGLYAIGYYKCPMYALPASGGARNAMFLCGKKVVPVTDRNTQDMFWIRAV